MVFENPNILRTINRRGQTIPLTLAGPQQIISSGLRGRLRSAISSHPSQVDRTQFGNHRINASKNPRRGHPANIDGTDTVVEGIDDEGNPKYVERNYDQDGFW